MNSNILKIKHSGRLGDIIASIPAALALSKLENKQIQYCIVINSTLDNSTPMVLKEDYCYLIPLFTYNNILIKIYNDDDVIDYDFDEFRKLNVDYNNGFIPQWFLSLTKTTYDLSNPWLSCKDKFSTDCNIIVTRSCKYLNSDVNYSVLLNYTDNVLFCGRDIEYDNIVKYGITKRIFINDYLELASIMKSSTLFVGNQSFPANLAEALKINRFIILDRDVVGIKPIGGIVGSSYSHNDFVSFLNTHFTIK